MLLTYLISLYLFNALINNQIAFPSPWYDFIFHLLRTLVDAYPIGNFAYFLRSKFSALPKKFILPQVTNKFLMESHFIQQLKILYKWIRG